MEICLIAPEAARVHGDPERLGQPLFPPLGLMTLAALTPSEHNVTIIDESVEPVDPESEPDVVGLTAMTAAAPRAYQLGDHFRARGVPVVMGGMHASALPEEALQHVDSVVVGEAEGLWPRLLADLASGDMQPVYRHTEYPDPSTIPAARRDLIDTSRYVAKHTLQATRGCPYACSFCTVSTFFGRTYRPRPVESVIAEAEEIGAGPIVLVDDNIMGQPTYAEQLFERWADLGKSFVSQASTTMLHSPELITQAARAGCKGLFVGFESISQAQLAKVGKRFNPVEKYGELVQRLHDAGIAVVGSFMFGLDGDDEDVFERTAEFAEEAEIDIGQFSILTPLPGTELYAQLEKEGRITDRDWSNYDGTRCTFQPVGLTAEKLESGLQWIYERLYSWKSIVRRVGKRLTPLVWMVNGIYSRRVKRWVAELRAQSTG
ncbi:MAG: radical SAM protein [Armatimonadota bacterium]|nr:radical SAM protein [Armatimonadota bacterium]